MKLTSGSMGCPSIYVFSRFVRIRTSAFGAEDCPPGCSAVCHLLSSGPIFVCLVLSLVFGPPALSHRKVTNCDRQIKPPEPAPHLRYSDRRPADNYPGDAELSQLTTPLSLTSSSSPTPISTNMFVGINGTSYNDTHRQLFNEGMAMLDANAALPLL
jgi:hypothetical protein